MMTENEILELLSDYLDGELDKPTRLQVEEGLRRYPSARRTLEQLSRTVNLLAALPRTPAPTDLAASIADKARRQVVLTHSGRRLLAHQARLVLWRRLGAAAAVLAVGCLAAFAVWRAQSELGVRPSTEVPVARGPETPEADTGNARPSPADPFDNESELGDERLRLQAATRPSEPVVGEPDPESDLQRGRPGYTRGADTRRDGGSFGNSGRVAGEAGLGGGAGARPWSTGGSDKNDRPKIDRPKNDRPDPADETKNDRKNDTRGRYNEKQYAQNGLKNASSLPSGAVVVKGDPAKVYALLKEALLQLESRGDARWSGSLDQLAQGHLPSVTITSDDPLVIEFVLGLLPKSPDVTGIEYASTAPTREEFARHELFRKARKAALESDPDSEGGSSGGKDRSDEDAVALAHAKDRKAKDQSGAVAPGVNAKTEPSPGAPPPSEKSRPAPAPHRPTDVKGKDADKALEGETLEAKAPEVYVLDPEGRQRRYLANKPADKPTDDGKAPTGPQKNDSLAAGGERGSKDAPKAADSDKKTDATKTEGKGAKPDPTAATASGPANAKKKKPGEHRTVEQAESGKHAPTDPERADNKGSAQSKNSDPKGEERKLGETKNAQPPIAESKPKVETAIKRETDGEPPKPDALADAKAKEVKEGKESGGPRHELRVRTDEVRRLLQELQLAVQPPAPEQPAKTGAAAPAGKSAEREKSATVRRPITLVLTLQPDQ